MRYWLRLSAMTAGCLLLGLALSAFLLANWLHAPAHHTVIALRYLLISGVVSLLIGVAALLAVSRYAPSLGIKITVASLAGSLAAFINVFVTPLLMFTERADKYLLAITLLYFLIISLAFASLVGVFTSTQIQDLRTGVRALAAGKFDTRVAVQGMDEVADLARMFNQMSSELGASFERQRRMEGERRDLIAAVSHDLRTPLTSIRAMVEAINDGVVTDQSEVRRYLHLIQQETQHLGALIDDLFELARIESGTVELRLASVPIGELVAETVDGLRIQAIEKGVELRATLAPDLPPLALDGPRMQRVLANLIENAVRHTGSGGRVDVEAGRENGHVRLAVADTGEGIPAEEQAQVFERFYRGDRSRTRGQDGGGAGLGLAIARGIVEAHHGTIELESAPGQGSRFVVIL